MEAYKSRVLKRLHTALDFGGFFFDGFDFANVLLYHLKGRDTEAAITLLCLILVMGNFLAVPVRLTLKLGSNAGEALVKLGKKYFPDAIENGSRFLNWAGGKIDDVWRWIQKKLGRAGAEGITEINPNEIIFSQSSVNGSSEIIASMKQNGWKGGPIDVVKMPDGAYTTIDNTRVVSAREAGINVQAIIHNYNDPLPIEYVERFTTSAMTC